MAGRWSGAGFEALNFSASFAFVGKVPGYGIVIAAWWCGVIAALQAAGRWRPDTRAFSPGCHIAGLRPSSLLRAPPHCGPSALTSPRAPPQCGSSALKFPEGVGCAADLAAVALAKVEKV